MTWKNDRMRENAVVPRSNGEVEEDEEYCEISVLMQGRVCMVMVKHEIENVNDGF